MKLCGKNPVLERLRCDPQSIRRIYIEYGHSDCGYVLKKAKNRGIQVAQVQPSKLIKIARNLNAQGMVAEVADFSYLSFSDMLDWCLAEKKTPIFLDGLNDPQNLGAIIRSVACLGGFGIVLPSHHSVGVTEAVLRIASGGENYVKVAKLQNLNQAIRKTKEAGFEILGTVVDEGEQLGEAKLNFPLGLVVGSEQKGIRDVTKKQVDRFLSIPVQKKGMSFNAAHATAIVCYEVIRQRALGRRV